MGARKLSVIQVARCPRDCLSIEVNGRTVRTFVILWVSAVEGYLLRGGGGFHCRSFSSYCSLEREKNRTPPKITRNVAAIMLVDRKDFQTF